MDERTEKNTLKRELEIARSQIEQYARAARIEAALEKVRASSLAMRHTSELQEVINTVGRQFRSLEINNTGGVFVIINEELDHDLHVWGFGDTATYSRKVHIRAIDRPIHTHLLDAIKNSKGFLAEAYSKEEKVEYFKHLFQHPPYNETSEEHQNQWLNRSGGYTRSGFISDHTTLFMINHHGVPFSEEENQILIRFAHVFEQSYIRFLDLKKAEQQAREAQIEAALERVRAQTMAMHKTEDLRKVVGVLYEQIGSLHLADVGCNINIFKEDLHAIESWMAAFDGVSFPDCYYIEGTEHPFLIRQWDQWRKQAAPFHISSTGEELKRYGKYIIEETDLKRIPDEIKEMMLSLPEAHYSFINFKYGQLEIVNSVKAPSQESIQILTRFVKVFEQTYTRFLDLKKAEAQAREAQIEAALEKVRSSSMSMYQSSELPDVALTLVNQLSSLGISHLGMSIIIITDREKITYDQFSAHEKLDGNGKYLNRVEDMDGSSLSLAKEIVRHIDHNEVDFSIPLQGEALHEFMVHTRDKIDHERGAAMLNSNLKKIYFHIAVFHNYSNIAITTLEPLPNEDRAILRRMADTFGQSYLRYKDLQKAEAQAREAQIEAALERIRAASMAMHKSEDLPAVALTFFNQIEQLDIPINAASINLVQESKESYQLYFANKHEIGTTSELNIEDFWFAKESISRLKKGEKEYTIICEGDKLKAWILFVKNEISEERGAQLEKAQLLKSYVHSVQFHELSHTIFASVSALPEVDVEVLRRMTRAFGMSYIRFLDLKKAEKQARESQIEAALERVRARSLAMHNSSELHEVVMVVHQQLKQVGLNFTSSNIGIPDDTTAHLDWIMWSAVDGTLYPTLMHIPYNGNLSIMKEFSIARKSGNSFFTHQLDKKETQNFWEYFFLHHPVEENRQKEVLQSPGVCLSAALLKNTAFCIMRYYPTPFTPEENKIISRFGIAFEQTYTRFLDLQKAEAQARESQVEAALERVRSQTMAMQSSHDIGISVTSLFESLVDLGISEKVRCGIGILNHEDTYMDVWTASSNTDHKVILSTGQIDMSKHPLLVGARNSWKNQDRHFRYTLKDEDLVNYHQIINQSARYPTKIDVATLPEEISHYSFVFDHGLLYAFADAPLPMDVMQILERLSTVFEHTYTRFLDLQRAELREKEAIKQASLDRIRAETASMRTARDLDQIIPLIWRELMILSIPFIRCGVFIMDEEDQVIHNYLSTPDGQAIASFQLPYDTPGTISQVLSSWRDKEIFIDYWDRSAMIDFANILVNTRIFSDPEEYLQSLPKEGFHLYFLPFLQGMLYVGNTDQLNPDQIDLLQAVSNAFSNAYARFEDFKKLEIAKAQVDQALQNLKDAQQQLIHSEKMASLGELTAGIAHEIQNPLNFVNNFSEIGEELVEEIKEILKENDVQAVEEILNELTQNLQKIHHHGERASGIVRGMLDHSRAKSDDKTPTDINQLCDEYLRLAYHGLRAKNKSFQADFSLEADTQIPTILVSSQDIGRVLLNLINNGFQATIDKSRKVINNYKPQLKIITKKQSDSITIQVQDNGAGIPVEIKEKIFQPFFTTKPTGQGTGLGLSLAYDIMKAHGGEIRVNSEPGKGTDFTLLLPLPK